MIAYFNVLSALVKLWILGELKDCIVVHPQSHDLDMLHYPQIIDKASKPDGPSRAFGSRDPFSIC
jgi:hypothetical protein